MNIDLAQEAVAFALNGNWEEAIKTNKKILTSTPGDIDALNRLSRAYAETGNFKKARSTALKVLKIDKFNSIAQKSLLRWKGIKKNEKIMSTSLLPSAFLEEPGKTKITTLEHLGDNKNVAGLNSGDEIKISCHGHRVTAVSMQGKYIGKFQDDISLRLRKLIKLGNTYQALIKSVDETGVKIFIRELSKSPGALDTLSFPGEKIDYISSTPPELVHKKFSHRAYEEEESF